MHKDVRLKFRSHGSPQLPLLPLRVTCGDSAADFNEANRGAMRQRRGRDYGGAALEYVIVSTFAAVVAVAALGFIGRVVKEQLTTLATKLGVDATPEIDNPLGTDQ